MRSWHFIAAWQLTAAAALQLSACLDFTAFRSMNRRAALVMLSPREEELAKKESAAAALRAAEDKLEELNAVEKAPASWADLGLPPEAPPPPAIPAWLSVAPAVIGGFSVLLFTLNALGLFGDGPDIDALVEEWSKV